MKVIVLDGNLRSSLAVTRSLGKKGIEVIAGSNEDKSLAGSSRYCAGSFCYPPPNSSPEEFIRVVGDMAERNAPVVLLPMSDVTVSEVLRQAGVFGTDVRVPFVPFDVYEGASDKAGLFRTALEMGVPVPETLFSCEYDSTQALLNDASKLGYPLVLKPARSRIRTPRGWLATTVRYAVCAGEFEELSGSEPFRSHPFLVQEKIIGPGIGIFLLMNSGRVLARFAHRRIREKPPWGGVSVLCESIAPSAQPLDAATRLLEKLQWTGVAMVELKLDERSGIARLMEINARFWGSLQLAVSAGVDFPHMLYRMAVGEDFTECSEYRIGLKSRWELGDLDHLLIRLRNRGSPVAQAGLPPMSGALKDFMLDFFRPDVRNEVLRPDDPRPFMSEFSRYMKGILYESFRNSQG